MKGRVRRAYIDSGIDIGSCEGRDLVVNVVSTNDIAKHGCASSERKRRGSRRVRGNTSANGECDIGSH